MKYKKMYPPENIGEILEQEDCVISSCAVNKDNTITAEVEVHFNTTKGDCFVSYHKMRFKNENK